MNILGMGSLELLVILVVALLVLGPARLASAGRTLGKLWGELRRSTGGLSRAVEDLLGEEATSTGESSEERALGKGLPPAGARARPKGGGTAGQTPIGPSEPPQGGPFDGAQGGPDGGPGSSPSTGPRAGG